MPVIIAPALDAAAGTPVSQRLTTIDAHVAGAAVRLVVDGWPAMTGRSFAERASRVRRRHDHLRVALMHEPRGHAAMSGAMLLEPSAPGAHAGLIFMNHAGWSGYCGHALMGAAAIALERGLIHRPGDTVLRIETAAGLVEVTAAGRRVRATAPAAGLVGPGVTLPLGGRTISVDLAWCAGLYVFTDAELAGVPLDLTRPAQLAERATEVRTLIEHRVLGGLPESLRRVEGITFVAPDERGEADLRSATVYDDGVVDRSPGGGATAALACVLDGMGMLPADRPLLHAGPRGTFSARVLSRTEREDTPAALLVEIESDVHVTGEHTFLLAADDPSIPWPATPSRASRARRR